VITVTKKNKHLILNTRPENRAVEFTSMLEESGFEVCEIPLVSIRPINKTIPSEIEPGEYNGVFFSSINGMGIFVDALNQEKKKIWLKKPVYTLSSVVLKAWEKLGGNVGFCSHRKSLEGFKDEFCAANKNQDMKWFHPCSLFTRLEPAMFRQNKISINNCPVYIPVLPSGTQEKLVEILPRVEGITFFSGSAVRNYFKCMKGSHLTMSDDFLKKIVFFSSGPSSSRELENFDMYSYHQAQSPLPMDMCTEIAKYFS